MSKAPKPSQRATPKAAARGGGRRRRAVIRVREASFRDRLRNLLERTHLLWGVGVTVCFALAVAVLASWAREQPLIALGQVMDETRTVRVEFTYTDDSATEQLRTDARQRTRRVFRADLAALDEIRTSLTQLPRTVVGVSDIGELSEDIRRRFGLSNERLRALKDATAPPKPPEPQPVPEAVPEAETPVETGAGGGQATQEGAGGTADASGGASEARADGQEGETAPAQPRQPEETVAAPETVARANPNLEAWDRAVAVLDEILRTRRPMLSGTEFQTATQEGLATQIELRVGDQVHLVSRNDAPINIGAPESLRAEVDRIVQIAGFTGLPAEIVRERLTREPPGGGARRPTFTYEADATTQAQAAAAAAVQDVVRSVPKGQIIFTRGDVLDQTQLELFKREMAEFYRQAPAWTIWAGRLGVGVAVLALSSILAGYVAVFSPPIARRSARILWLAIVLFVALAASTVIAVLKPDLTLLALLTPTTLVAVLLAVAYTPRTALALGAVIAGLAVLALDLGFTAYLLAAIGIATAVSLLGDISRRRAIVRMSVSVAAVLAVAAAGIALIDQPPTGALFEQTVTHALQAALSGLLAGMVTLFVLPYIERVFDIATGMTLIELRDPKQPLLREMQQRAPGTYNHSLNVAAIAESAAASIGADALLTYVGCLYHDIGKINKPEYFVENQARGINKHDKLSPAMSLLVIVGHVKDGLEMAREHHLPKALHHFIEAHHGTTLVEFFYKRARQKAEDRSAEGAAEADAEKLPSELDYRYPGPRPRTKEVAIVMLADAVESATRSLPEPTPSRIDALVRDFANRRLMDGQFDDCDLTLRELNTISDSISKSVASIYHGRVSYSDPKKPDAPDSKVEPKPARPEPDSDDSGDEPREKSA
ncbi:MAG: HD family phosphohydrolase [Phycisphaerales bacterium JB040]